MSDVMIVDDSVDACKKISSVLIDKGFNVVETCSNSSDALRIYKKLLPDVVVLDYNMPKGNGVKVIEQIRNFDQTAKCVFILFHNDAALNA